MRSILATPLVSLVTIAAIAIGISVSMTMVTIRHIFDSDPIPQKSSRLFNVRVDNWDPNGVFFAVPEGEPPKTVTYHDMERLLKSDIPTGQTGIASAMAYVFPEKKELRPYQAMVTLCHANFFPMFDVPFAYGSGWSKEDDAQRGLVVVLTAESNDRLFGGEDSVGRKVKLGPNYYTVVGVMEPWRMVPNAYDMINNPLGNTQPFFMPFDSIRETSRQLTRTGNIDGWGPTGTGPDAFFTMEEVNWVQFWVELPKNQVASYTGYVDSYVTEQKAFGRFPKPMNNRVTPLVPWVQERDFNRNATQLLTLISLLFLLVCALNLSGLLLGKFVARANQVGVHRALGASKSAIFWQHLMECNLVGIVGGLVGLGLTFAGLWGVNSLLPSQFVASNLFQMDMTMLITTILLAVLASAVSGLYPAWRACSIEPAIQIKIQ